MAATTVTVRVVDFKRGVRYAKQFGGRFNPDSKTWEIPADRPELGAIGAYGLAVVKGRGGCPHYTDDQGCPLHGEICRNWR